MLLSYKYFATHLVALPAICPSVPSWLKNLMLPSALSVLPTSTSESAPIPSLRLQSRTASPPGLLMYCSRVSMIIKSFPVAFIFVNLIFCFDSRRLFMSTSSMFSALYLDMRQFAIALAVSMEVKQGMSRSTAWRLIITESA